jgi:glutathione synthase/RimK-type ligase-like ATP-grasp enzyme
MADLAILYDKSESDELGIKLTAEQLGIDLEYLPFYKVAFGFNKDGYEYRSSGKNYTPLLKNIKVVLNRGQSKNRRVFAASIMEALGKKIINPLTVEVACQSKIRSLVKFMEHGINIPKTVYVPCNVEEELGSGGVIDNSNSISHLIESQLSSNVVIKPDAGTHGRSVSLSHNHKELLEILQNLKNDTTNPAGVVAQELIPKWFYDLRIIVSKEKGRKAYCQPVALVRGGFREFRTNTFLGNMVVHVDLPKVVQKQAEKCGEALADGSEAWLIAMDAMPNIESKQQYNEEEIKQKFIELEKPFKEVTKVKADVNKKLDFVNYSINVEKAYSEYKRTEAYNYIQGVVSETLHKTAESVVFHEGNSCPEFWEQTRIIAGINVAEPLLACAISLLDR